MQGVVGLSLAFFLVACGNSYTQRAQRIESGILGLSGREVIRCMGPPEDLDYESDVHGLWVYVRPLDEPRGLGPDADLGVSSRAPDWHRGPRESAMNDPEERAREFLLHPTTAPIADGYCLLKFEVAEDEVRGFESRGRTHEGLNADARCALVARFCVEPEG